jgi:hypothetical protein
MSDCTHVQFFAPTCKGTLEDKADFRRSAHLLSEMSDCTYVQRGTTGQTGRVMAS